MKYNLPLAKTFASPHTPRALFAHTIQHHLGDHFQQTSTKKNQNLCHPVKYLKHLSHHYHPLMNPQNIQNLPEVVKGDLKEG